MPRINGGKFFSNCSSRLFQGQTRIDSFRSLHYDNRKLYIKYKKALITKRLHWKSYFVLCRIKQTRRFKFFLDKINDMAMEGTRWALLVRLFVKYVTFRYPYLDSSVMEDLAYIAAAMIAVSSENSAKFEPENLWGLVASRYLLNVPHIFIDALAEVIGQEICEGPSNDPKFMGVSLFGEFLFYCAVIDRDPNSPMARIRNNATEEEALLVDEISMAITPELGLLTFILYRNLANSINCVIPFRTREFYVLSNRVISFKIFPSVSNEFSKSRKMVQRIPNLEYCFRKFLNYLGTEISQCLYYFGNPVLNMNYLIYLHNDIYLPFPYIRMADMLFILKYVLDILLFLYNKNKEIPIEQIIHTPEFLANILNHENLTNDSFIYKTQDGCYQCVSAMLIALSQFLDFLYVENWNTEVWNPFLFLRIWNDVNNDLRTRSVAIKDFVDDYKLFPFFQYCDESYFIGLSHVDNSWHLALEMEQSSNNEAPDLKKNPGLEFGGESRMNHCFTFTSDAATYFVLADTA